MFLKSAPPIAILSLDAPITAMLRASRKRFTAATAESASRRSKAAIPAGCIEVGNVTLTHPGAACIWTGNPRFLTKFRA